MPLVPALWKLRRKDQEFKASLDCGVIMSHFGLKRNLCYERTWGSESTRPVVWLERSPWVWVWQGQGLQTVQGGIHGAAVGRLRDRTDRSWGLGQGLGGEDAVG